MPIYEYRCASCRRKQSVLVRSFSSAVSPSCDGCGSVDMTRLISTFAILRSDQDLMKSYDSSDWISDLDPDDPEGLNKIKQWSQAHGVDNDSVFGPDNASQDYLGDLSFGGPPMGGFDEGLHSEMHGLGGGDLDD